MEAINAGQHPVEMKQGKRGVRVPEDTTTQAAIVQKLRKGRERAASKRKQAEGIRTSAWKDFIAAVFT